MCLGSLNGYIMCTTAVNLNEKKKKKTYASKNKTITELHYFVIIECMKHMLRPGPECFSRAI